MLQIAATTLLQVLAAWLLADFITGLFHWIEDRYLDSNQTLEFFQGVALDNAQHHRQPTALCLVSWWDNMRSAAVFAWALSCCGAVPVVAVAWNRIHWVR